LDRLVQRILDGAYGPGDARNIEFFGSLVTRRPDDHD
jgi:hypothetical protein